MITRRDAALGMLVGVSAMALSTGGAIAQNASEKDALEAMNPWADALFSGNATAIAKVLAPEYQIVRSDGTGFDKAGYMKTLPKQTTRSKFSDIVATRTGNVMAMRYRITTEQTIEGKKLEAVSPRLSVFRKEGTTWLLVSHANFGRLG